MRRSNGIALAWALALGLAGLLEAQDLRERRLEPIRVAGKHALLIGNASYAPHATNLPNTLGDVRALEAVLRELGFKTTRRENLTKQEMDRALEDFEARLGSQDIALFYYSGHGVQEGTTNYLVPVDYEPGRSLLRSALPVYSHVVEPLEQRAQVRVVVLDACRNNPYAGSGSGGRTKSAGTGLAEMEPDAAGTLIAFAAKAGGTALDEDPERPGSGLGLYATHLISELRQPRVELGEAFERAQQRVYRASGERQLPAIYDQVIGDLYLRGSPGVGQIGGDTTGSEEGVSRIAGGAGRAGVDSGSSMEAAWGRVKQTSDPAVLEDFIRNHEGNAAAVVWVALARKTLRSLRERRVREPAEKGVSSGQRSGRRGCLAGVPGSLPWGAGSGGLGARREAGNPILGAGGAAWDGVREGAGGGVRDGIG